jgi:hypothetical protein
LGEWLIRTTSGGGELDLVGERGLGGEHAEHDGDHGQEKLAAADAVDQELMTLVTWT